MNTETSLDKYKKILSEMRVENDDLDFIPHCPILMLGIIDMAGMKHGHSNKWRWNENYMEDHFRECWEMYIKQRTPTRDDFDLAFSRMKYEPFCTYWPDGSIKFDDELFLLIRDNDSRLELRSAIANFFFPIHKVDFAELDATEDSTLRDYQIAEKKKVFEFLKDNKRVMLQMPTGTGKTRLFVSIVKDLHNWGVKNKKAVKVLILAHRRELIDQIDTELGVKYGLAHGIIMSQNAENKKYPVQVGCVPTMQRRIDDWGDKDFDFIIVDEAHHVKADSYKQIIKRYPNAKLLGLTATPYRLNGAGFKKEFDGLILSEPVKWFIDNHYLSDYVYYSIKPDSDTQESIDEINKFGLDGDYAESSMVSVMDTDHVRAQIIDAYLKYAKGKKGIVYCVNKEHNQHVCERYRELGLKAAAIDCNTPKEEREKLVGRFRRGELQILCNVNIFSEGFDCPDVEFIQLARPTKSLSMYLQQTGRGLRPAQGKEEVIILDNVGLYNKFGFPSARRKWQHHFEGKDVEYESGVGEGGEHDIHYFGVNEGEEEMHKLFSTKSEEDCNVEPVECDMNQFERIEQKEQLDEEIVEATCNDIPEEYVGNSADYDKDPIELRFEKEKLEVEKVVFEKYHREVPYEILTRLAELDESLDFEKRLCKLVGFTIRKYGFDFPFELYLAKTGKISIVDSAKFCDEKRLEELKKERGVFEKYSFEVPSSVSDEITRMELFMNFNSALETDLKDLANKFHIECDYKVNVSADKKVELAAVEVDEISKQKDCIHIMAKCVDEEMFEKGTAVMLVGFKKVKPYLVREERRKNATWYPVKVVYENHIFDAYFIKQDSDSNKSVLLDWRGSGIELLLKERFANVYSYIKKTKSGSAFLQGKPEEWLYFRFDTINKCVVLQHYDK